MFPISLKYGRDVLFTESILYHNNLWGNPIKNKLLIRPMAALSAASVRSSDVLSRLVFTSAVGSGYAHLDQQLFSMPETVEHRVLRSRKSKLGVLPEFPFLQRPPETLDNVWTSIPKTSLEKSNLSPTDT